MLDFDGRSQHSGGAGGVNRQPKPPAAQGKVNLVLAAMAEGQRGQWKNLTDDHWAWFYGLDAEQRAELHARLGRPRPWNAADAARYKALCAQAAAEREKKLALEAAEKQRRQARRDGFDEARRLARAEIGQRYSKRIAADVEAIERAQQVRNDALAALDDQLPEEEFDRRAAAVAARYQEAVEPIIEANRALQNAMADEIRRREAELDAEYLGPAATDASETATDIDAGAGEPQSNIASCASTDDDSEVATADATSIGDDTKQQTPGDNTNGAGHGKPQVDTAGSNDKVGETTMVEKPGATPITPDMKSKGSGNGVDANKLALLDETVAECAKLSRKEYELVRPSKAAELDIRVSALDQLVAEARGGEGDGEMQGRALDLTSPEPWPSAVDGAALLEKLATMFKRHVALSEGAADALALWALHTHVYDTSPITPRLSITSPTFGCGKTTLLCVLGAVVDRPLPAANVTTAALFRTVELSRPTLLIDEADSFLMEAEELRGILNAGHRRGTPVIRLVGDDHEPRQFAVFAPAAIACIGKLPVTLMSRSIEVRMRRRRPDELVEDLVNERPQGADRLARQCARWAIDHGGDLTGAAPRIPKWLHNRAADNWRPLFAVADAVGGDWPARARTAAQLLAAGNDTSADDSVAIMLLRDIRALFTAEKTDRLRSETICTRLGAMDDRPWPEWKGGKPITQRQLAKLVGPFGIIPGTIRMEDGSTPKGYYLAAFADAFERYLPPSDPPQRHNAHKISSSRDSGSATKDQMWRIENDVKSAPDEDCGVVADQNPESGAVGHEEEETWTTE